MRVNTVSVIEINIVGINLNRKGKSCFLLNIRDGDSIFLTLFGIVSLGAGELDREISARGERERQSRYEKIVTTIAKRPVGSWLGRTSTCMSWEWSI